MSLSVSVEAGEAEVGGRRSVAVVEVVSGCDQDIVLTLSCLLLCSFFPLPSPPLPLTLPSPASTPPPPPSSISYCPSILFFCPFFFFTGKRNIGKEGMVLRDEVDEGAKRREEGESYKEEREISKWRTKEIRLKRER